MIRHRRDDRITLVGIKINPRIGVTEQERAVPQKCEVDLTVEDNFEGAASQDSLENSIDYSLLLSTVQEIAAEGEFSLVETLAYKLVRTVLQAFPVKRVRVKVRKTPESLSGQIDYVEVDVEDC